MSDEEVKRKTKEARQLLSDFSNIIVTLSKEGGEFHMKINKNDSGFDCRVYLSDLANISLEARMVTIL